MILYKLFYTIIQISVRKAMLAQNCCCVPVCVEVCTANVQCHTFHHNQNIHCQFAKTLEKELKLNSDKHQTQNDCLSKSIAQLKLLVRKYQARHKLDKDNIKDLQAQIENLKKRTVKTEIQKTKIQIKQVKIKQDNSQLLDQIKILTRRNKELSDQLIKVKSQLNTLLNENGNLNIEVQKYKSIQKKLNRQIERLKLDLSEEQERSYRLKNQINQLQAEISTITHQVVYQEKQKIIEKIVTKIQTVYVEKPIQRLVCVEIPKVIRQFIEPPRAVVNRIIECQDKCQCKKVYVCKQVSEESQQECQCKTVMQDVHKVVSQYKEQREKLVDLIQDQNRQISDLQHKFAHRGPHHAHYHHHKEPTVNVTVTRPKKKSDGHDYEALMHRYDDSDDQKGNKRKTKAKR